MMTFDEILNKFIMAELLPTRHSVQRVLGISANTLRRKGFNFTALKAAYKLHFKIPKFCKNCNEEIDDLDNIFCSSKCSAIFNNAKRVKIINSRLCPICGNKITSEKARCCSRRCDRDFKNIEIIGKWLSGVNPHKISSVIRKYLFVKYNHKCCKCGWGEVNTTSGKIPLEIEHKDGNSNNNLEYNLELLCPNCHSLTSTYKSLNKGNGRHSRRLRYKEGKSY